MVVPIVDREKCIGCGLCVSLCPDTFELDEEGKSRVIGGCDKCDCKEVVESCPVQAISIGKSASPD